jgi:ferredoxin-NADP reductase
MRAQLARAFLIGSLLIGLSRPVAGHLDQTGYANPTRDIASGYPDRYPADAGIARPDSIASERVVVAQSPDGHSEHHPGTPPATGDSPASSASGPAGAPGGPQTGDSSGRQPPSSGAGAMGGGMGEMMGGMMGRPRKEFYPSLMALPALSPEQRQRIEAQARDWISAGTDGIASAENALRHANAAGDTVGAEQAASRLREALNQVKSGTTVLRSLAEGKPPQQIALDWFKREMNLATDGLAHEAGPLGLSWFHLITMALVTAFAAAMLAIYLLRMRRANALIDRLTATPAVAVAAVAAPAVAAAPPTLSQVMPTVNASPGTAGSVLSSPAPAPNNMPARTGLWKGQLRVAAIFRETPQVMTFRLRDPKGGPIPFSFVPGQFLTYSAEIDGKLVRRSYTIASSAAQTAYVETTIKREDKGVFSDYMHEKVAVGDLIDVMGPSGAFTFSGKEADSVVLIGGGVGITPLMAAIRYLADIAWPGEIFLIYGARSTSEFIFRDELEHRQRRMPNLHVAATMARSAGTSWMGAEGPINREFLAQSVPDLTKRHIHLCGPPGMMQAMRTLLADLGVPAEQVKTEAFGPALGAVPPPGVTEVASINGANAAATAVATGAPMIGPATASIRFSKSNKVAALPPDKSVLEIAESAGVPIDFSCRAGICGVCKTRLLEGKVTMEVEEALTADDKAQGVILACQAKSIGNLVVEA